METSLNFKSYDSTPRIEISSNAQINNNASDKESGIEVVYDEVNLQSLQNRKAYCVIQ